MVLLFSSSSSPPGPLPAPPSTPPARAVQYTRYGIVNDRAARKTAGPSDPV